MVWEAERLLKEKQEMRRHKMNTRSGKGEGGGRTWVPLSYIDDVNSVRVGKTDLMDEALD